MKNKLIFLASLLVSASAVFGVPLPATTAVHVAPDEHASTITFLKAGSEPTPVPGSLTTTPAGWLAVELPGPFEGYVLNKDILKSLDVRPGAAIRLQPKPDAGVLTTMTASDKTTITGLHGKWTQIRLEKKLTGYIQLAGTPAPLPPIAVAPATATPAPMAAAPVPATAYGTTASGKPAPNVNLGDSSGAMLPRLFQGKFVSTRSPFRPRRPYDWALNDDAGSRYAFLDISKLLLTDQIENYVGHTVVAYGAAKPVPNSKDIVIEVESLQLK